MFLLKLAGNCPADNCQQIAFMTYFYFPQNIAEDCVGPLIDLKFIGSMFNFQPLCNWDGQLSLTVMTTLLTEGIHLIFLLAGVPGSSLGIPGFARYFKNLAATANKIYQSELIIIARFVYTSQNIFKHSEQTTYDTYIQH